MKKSVFTLCFLLLSFTALSLRPVIEKDAGIIVMFSQKMEVVQLNELSAFQFTSISALNAEKTLFLFRYDFSKIGTLKATEKIQNLPYFLTSQLDGPIELRNTIPNDTLYSKQWHHGLIKSAEAWDLCRSGVNRRGDTIVIAIIDDGLHINHPDFKGNIWINEADSAGNGIDDDNNGFIDDHYGWNFMSRNNDISDSTYYKGNHGTPIAGIIGATGNNTTGVTGIMWHVKLMIVDLADTGIFPGVFQSDVIRAYSYVLHQRKLYNSSGGKKGAFVVATNSSWGVNSKFPFHAPIWCGMYDTLGKYGIMNIGAATNSQVNVDTDGDLPTLCPSKHLIAVGSSTINDNYFSCGYSTTSIDISAPGANIYSTAAYTKLNINSNNIYRNGFSGTSFAAPMVTAAIGVLHTYACERLLDTIKINPARGNELMRRFILEGADVLQGLNGKNVTSGRLNIKRSMQIMDQYCFGELKLNNPVNAHTVYLFPNPGNGVVQLESDIEIKRIECFDLTGRLIDSHYDGEKLTINTPGAGMYFIRIYTGEQVFTFKYERNESE